MSNGGNRGGDMIAQCMNMCYQRLAARDEGRDDRFVERGDEGELNEHCPFHCASSVPIFIVDSFLYTILNVAW